MANQSIYELTQETTLAAADRFLVQQTSAATRATSATFALMGGLEISNETVTTGDVTGVAGTMHVCTIAGLTANRNLTLPSAQVGERVGVYIVDGDATYELILKGAASQTINGGSAATEWSRVFIANECVVFLCIAANTWIVESDGRIACKAMIKLTADSPTLTSATDYAWSAIDGNGSSELYDVGGILNATDGRATIRRTGQYIIHNSFFNSIAGSSNYTSILLDPDGSQYRIAVFFQNSDGTLNNLIRNLVSSNASLSSGDVLEYTTKQTTNWAAKGDTNEIFTFWSLSEIL